MIRILLLASAFNSLTQRVLTELRDRGHPVAVELAVRGEDESLTAAVARHAPELLVAPMLTSAIPEAVWRSVTCLVVHPGPPGDRGPSALDRAVQDGVARWGVTVLQAVAELDAGPVWAAAEFAVPPGVAKSDLYRGELADAAVAAVLTAVERFAASEPDADEDEGADEGADASAADGTDCPCAGTHADEPGGTDRRGTDTPAWRTGRADGPVGTDLPRTGDSASQTGKTGDTDHLGAGPAVTRAEDPELMPETNLDRGLGCTVSARTDTPAPDTGGIHTAGPLRDAGTGLRHSGDEERFRPRPPATSVWRPFLRQEERRIDWAADTTATVLRKLRAADSRPGVLDTFLGAEWYLHGGWPEETLTGPPGAPLATCAGALCRATVDGAVWIPQMRPRRAPGGPSTYRLPSVTALGPLLPAALPDLPDLPAGPGPLLEAAAAGAPAPDGGPDRHPSAPTERRTWPGIRYEERGRVGLLRFSFPGGAMGTDACRRLLAAYRLARTRPVEVLVLGGERDFFSNGIDLNLIEAAADPAAESLANIEAIDDLVAEILTTTDRLVVAALGGNAAAGGVMLALAADEVWCRAGVVLNPHYRLMGLYGSEYWTYTLPRRVGRQAAERLTEAAQPLGTAAARSLGLVDRVLDCGPGDFPGEVARAAERLAHSGRLSERLGAKKAARDRDERLRPLSAYRAAELAQMRAVFDDPAAPYHALRAAFVHKAPPSDAGGGRRR